MSRRRVTLPDSWTSCPISQVAEVNPRTQLPSKDSDELLVPLYEMAAIDETQGTLRAPQMVPLRTGRGGRSKFTNGDVVFAKITPCVQNGKAALVQGVQGGLGFGSSEFYVLRAGPRVLPQYLFYFLRQAQVVDKAVATFTGTSGRQRVPSAFWDSLQIPVPPLPVQERIVACLEVSAEIERKRRVARETAESILASAFMAAFGDPRQNGDRFAKKPLGSLADVRAGVTKGRKLRGQATVEAPYLRVANVQDGFLDLREVKSIEVLPADLEKYRLEDGDIVMTEGGDPDKLGRGCIWRGEVKGCIHQNHVFRVRTDQNQLLPEYLGALMRSAYAKDYFLSCAKRSSNLASINSTQVKAFAVPVPSIELQRKFVMAVEQWERTADRLNAAYAHATHLFRSLSHHAFNGDLTAEFEHANAAAIEQAHASEKLIPRRLLLATLVERSRRGIQESLVTALMKFVFLVQMNGGASRRVYQFVPYHYGPFAKELYKDLDQLAEDRLIRIDNGDEDKARISLLDPGRAAQEAGQLPGDLFDGVRAVLDDYGGLGHAELLKRVYEEYPAYTKKSRLRKKAAKKQVRGSRA